MRVLFFVFWTKCTRRYTRLHIYVEIQCSKNLSICSSFERSKILTTSDGPEYDVHLTFITRLVPSGLVSSLFMRLFYLVCAFFIILFVYWFYFAFSFYSPFCRIFCLRSLKYMYMYASWFIHMCVFVIQQMQ